MEIAMDTDVSNHAHLKQQAFYINYHITHNIPYIFHREFLYPLTHPNRIKTDLLVSHLDNCTNTETNGLNLTNQKYVVIWLTILI